MSVPEKMKLKKNGMGNHRVNLEILMGMCMLLLVAGINFYSEERSAIIQPAYRANEILYSESQQAEERQSDSQQSDNQQTEEDSSWCVVLDAGHGSSQLRTPPSIKVDCFVLRTAVHKFAYENQRFSISDTFIINNENMHLIFCDSVIYLTGKKRIFVL